ncbi:MAG: MMPL family transporter, partial [Thermodesulfobacteriota bacterium]
MFDSRKHQLARGAFFAFCLVLIGLLGTSLLRIRIDTNIVNTLPEGNPVMAEGSYVLLHHPFQNQVFIDLSLASKDPDRLTAGAQVVEEALEESGLFKSVGFENMDDLLPALMQHVAENLPLLFSKRQLESEIGPLLADEKLKERARNNLSRLYTMEAVGQAEMIMNDPLGLSGLILAQFKQLLPAETVHFYKGRLLSQDRRHLLIIANPKTASTHAANARRIAGSIEAAKTELVRAFEKTGSRFTLTPVGAYRAVLDNETTAKSDTKNAILFAGLGIACLLLLAFPRPLIGLLAFLPAVFGTLCALALYALWHDSISVMTIGFGGAIISITVDHGISYLLFLDRPHETRGKTVSREVVAVAFLAAMTSVGAFLMLTFSGFPILAQIGQFAAFGIAFSFLYVHSIFPLLFPRLRPARRSRTLFLQRLVDKLAGGGGGSVKAAAALLPALGLAFFAHPDFNVNMASINTI